MLQFILWVYPWVRGVFKKLWPFGFIVLTYLGSRDNHGRCSLSNFIFYVFWGPVEQRPQILPASSSVLTSGNHGSQFLYRLQSNIALKMEKVPLFSYTDDCFTNHFCFFNIKEIETSKQVYDTVVYEFFTDKFGDDDIASDEESKGASELLRGLESN